MGVGAADRINKVRWNLAGNILAAWLITIPLSGLLAAGVYSVLHIFLK
jgi:inorganic phosphate transporter, PiT family